MERIDEAVEKEQLEVIGNGTGKVLRRREWTVQLDMPAGPEGYSVMKALD